MCLYKPCAAAFGSFNTFKSAMTPIYLVAYHCDLLKYVKNVPLH